MGDILKEAIADAKAVRETALQNAKMALEEAFTPQLKSMLSAKLKEAPRIGTFAKSRKNETIFDVAKRVVKNRSAEKYKSGRGTVLLDMQSANLLTKVFKKVNPKMKKILSDLGYKNPAQLMSTLWAVAKAG